MPIKLVKTSEPGFKSLWQRILARRGAGDGSIDRRVSEIIETVRRQGDRAVLRYTARFDHVRLNPAALEVKKTEIEAALKTLPRENLSALRLAAKRIALFHRHQLQKSWRYRDRLGIMLGQRITPLARVGIYVPGGKALYPSTVLMNAIPAKVAGGGENLMHF